MKQKRIVTIGGGTGSFTLLSGLKQYPVHLSAIVAMTDDGGSTGILRDELGVLPPGDVRQCLVALSESSEELRRLMNYRFEDGGLKGHSFGNLFLSALEKISGSFTSGIEEAMRILNVRGAVIPVTDQNAQLKLILRDGSVLEGEDQINQNKKFQKVGVKKLCFHRPVRAYAKALKCIKEADIIVIGPGNLYCSLLPNLIVPEVAQATRESKASVMFVANLTNKKGHTTGWTVEDYAEEIERYIGRGRLDYLIFNSKRPPKNLVAQYEKSEGKQSLVELRSPKASRTYKVVAADIVSASVPKSSAADAIAHTRALIRHDSKKLAQVIIMLSEMAGSQNIIREII